MNQITRAQIKRLLIKNNLPVGDARQASWRGAQRAYVIAQDIYTTNKYIEVHVHWPHGESEPHEQALASVLNAAGIRFGGRFHLGIAYIHPLQLDEGA